MRYPRVPPARPRQSEVLLEEDILARLALLKIRIHLGDLVGLKAQQERLSVLVSETEIPASGRRRYLSENPKRMRDRLVAVRPNYLRKMG